MEFKIGQDKKGKFRFRIVDDDNVTLMNSARAYASSEDCKVYCISIKAAFTADHDEMIGNLKEHRGKLECRNSKLLDQLKEAQKKSDQHIQLCRESEEKLQKTEEKLAERTELCRKNAKKISTEMSRNIELQRLLANKERLPLLLCCVGILSGIGLGWIVGALM